MSWFSYLKEQGFFNPENNPIPVQKESGYQIPSWEVLDYLISIATKFERSEHLELVPEILQIIKDVSEHPVDNYHTWYRLIKILSLVPNENVTNEYLDYIPVWVTSQFDTMLQTSEITDSLLPKFLTDNPNDREKAEIILYYLFELRTSDNLEDFNRSSTVQYYSPYYSYTLNNAFHNEGLLDKIINLCHNKTIYRLLEQINFLLRDHVIVAEGKIGETNYIFKIFRIFEKMIVRLEKSSNGETVIIDEVSQENYLKLDKVWFNQFLTDLFDKNSLDKVIYEDVYNRLSFNFWSDYTSIIGYEGIKDLDENSHYNNPILGVFSFNLREWLTKLVTQDSESLQDVLNDFIEDEKFNLPYFKRMLFYIVAEDWSNLKSFFWKLLDEKDSMSLFSTYAYRLELHYLLSKVSTDLNEEEQKLIWKIIENGPIGDKHLASNKDEWQHRWLDALKENSFFSAKFLTIEEQSKITKDYSEEGKIVVRMGHVTPFSKDEILKMSDEQLLNELDSFKSNYGFDDPTIDGFAEAIKEAVEEDPNRFAHFVEELVEIKFIYASNIISGFSKAWRLNRDFDWDKVMKFCYAYITNESFKSNKLQLEDDFRVTKDWIIGEIGMLITSGAQNEQHSFDSKLLPNCKKVLLQCLDELPKDDFSTIQSGDFILHSLNSTAGHVLTGLLNYSLKYARNLPNNQKVARWDIEAKLAFEQSFENHIDSYVLFGKFLSQFMFLDNTWVNDNLSKVEDYDDIKWEAFMSGIAFRNPLNIDFYKILYSSYQRAIDSDKILTFYNHGLLRHFLAYYFWNYENSFEESFLYKSLKNPNIHVLQKIISLLRGQKSIIDNDQIENKEDLINKILKVWGLINQSIEKITDSNDSKLLEGVVYLTDFIEKLDEENVLLVEENMKKFQNQIVNIHITEALSRWINNSPAHLISRIALLMKINYVYKKEPILNVLVFLYENQQNIVANHIINRLVKEGYDYFRPIYQQYNK
ncbi:hypothetical protein EGI15_02690 [Chryseobacterium cucumeris]|uniref:Uncharacterized protein n=1 Tax=Chryseobacterium cucumeris TaxID=1813611 RepID=A0ABX9XBL7_9FLAO|nr:MULTISPECIES: hypothetical protein [Chryseobacterium]RKE81588.1 hypothetical protein DEU39_1126 [Chryseobacterium sp. AG363]ROH94785.1 hypothetical protein EGI15_02690 [Chryseobacterium cucumeris]